MVKTICSHSAVDTEKIGKRFGTLLKGNEVIAMFGGLGMGKTTFTRGLAAGLEIDEGDISSPTFALVHEHSGRCMLYHFDMYRVTSWDDLYSTGFFDYLGNGVMLIEWSENIEFALPEHYIKVEINKGEGDFDREFVFSCDNDFGDFDI